MVDTHNHVTEPIASARLTMAPLGADDADEAADFLMDQQLYAIIGGAPSSRGQAQRRIQRWIGGSGDPTVTWVNYVARERQSEKLIAIAQATIDLNGEQPVCTVAYLVAPAVQGLGIGTEMMHEFLGMLRASVSPSAVFEAHIAAQHTRSERLAQALGMRLTERVVDDERVWAIWDTDRVADTGVLTDPVNASLDGPHRKFRLRSGRVSRYHPDVSVFFGHPRELTSGDYDDVARLVGPHEVALLRDRTSPLPDGWNLVETIGLVQYDGSAVEGVPIPDEAVRLTVADVDEMTELVKRTNPGPFLPRTIELGTFFGVRDADGTLIAMAGERMHPPGWTEISGVCTAPEARGRGLATRLIRAVAAEIRSRGDTPFLHTSDDNPARKLYEDMGFVLASEVPLEVVQVPR